MQRLNKLKESIANGSFDKVYLFFGEESYLIKEYQKKIYEVLIPSGSEAFNYTFFEGKAVDYLELSDACETLPFMNDKRLVVAKNTELFVQGRKASTEAMTDYIGGMSDSCVLVFIEEKVDKRNRLYKEVSKNGHCVEFKKKGENDLLSFVQEMFKKENIKIDNGTSFYFIRSVGTDMNSLKKEAEKLFSLKKNEGIVYKEDIDNICTKSLETKIFDLVDAIGEKRIDRALEIYNNLLMLKQSPLRILSMIDRQFRMILQCKYLAKGGASNNNIASAIGANGFVVKEYIRQSSNFSNMSLLNAIKDCLNCDVDIKTGKISEELGVEMIIVKYGRK